MKNKQVHFSATNFQSYFLPFQLGGVAAPTFANTNVQFPS